MAELWDTTVVSRLHPASETLEYVLDAAVGGEPVRVAPPAILEVVYGYRLKAPSDVRYEQLADWFTRLVASDAFRVIPFDGRAAVVAGDLRAASPYPPAKRKGDSRSKTMRQASWLLDIEIAATAFAAGLDVATENRCDFEVLADLLAELYPEAPPLAVIDAPV